MCLELLQTGSGAPAGDVSSDLAPQLLARRPVRIDPSPWVYPAAPCAAGARGNAGEGWEFSTIPVPGVSQVFLYHQESKNSALVGKSSLLDVFEG